uniref:Achaete-scute family bHLH transcription factor 4 n=1 Tax=Oryzias latipes TaxID=8090 RepID=A0A3P9IPN7_ORYLA
MQVKKDCICDAENMRAGQKLPAPHSQQWGGEGGTGDALSIFDLDAAYFDPIHGQRLPCRRLSYLPFRTPFGLCDYSFEPAFIQKRNERERHRVRCVNEGYARLREHLPQEFEDKRLSKVETLRAAIDYIKRLQSLLELNASGRHVALGEARGRGALPSGTDCSSDGETKTSFSDSSEA